MQPLKKMISFSLPVAMGFLVFQGIIIKDAYAYIDPGSGSIIFQAIIGALIGVGIALKLYWEKVKYKLVSSFARKKSD